MTLSPERPYEFNDAQNSTFARLAGAMRFVAAAMLVLGAVLSLAAIVLARSTLEATAILAPLGITVGLMGAQLFVAGRRFRRIVTTRGSDINNLMKALDGMVAAYVIQRWLWITLSLVVAIGLTFTTVGR